MYVLASGIFLNLTSSPRGINLHKLRNIRKKNIMKRDIIPHTVKLQKAKSGILMQKKELKIHSKNPEIDPGTIET